MSSRAGLDLMPSVYAEGLDLWKKRAAALSEDTAAREAYREAEVLDPYSTAMFEATLRVRRTSRDFSRAQAAFDAWTQGVLGEAPARGKYAVLGPGGRTYVVGGLGPEAIVSCPSTLRGDE